MVNAKPERGGTAGKAAVEFKPTQKQLDTFAHRLLPEIKSFFADGQIRKEFAEWQEKNNKGK